MRNIDLYKHVIYAAYSYRFIERSAKDCTYKFFNSDEEKQRRILEDFYEEGAISIHFKKYYQLLNKSVLDPSFVDWMYCKEANSKAKTNLIYLAPFINDIIDHFYDDYSFMFCFENEFPNADRLAQVLLNLNECCFLEKNQFYQDMMYSFIERIDNQKEVQFSSRKNSVPYSILEDVIHYIKNVQCKEKITHQEYLEFFESDFVDLQKYKGLNFNLNEINNTIL